jgi:hypothetical protein
LKPFWVRVKVRADSSGSSEVPAGKLWSAVVPEGYYLTIVDLEGQQGVDFLCYNADDPEERYHAPNTLKAIQTLKLTAGHHLYFDIARPIFTINFDSCDGHDTIAGCCSAPSKKMLYGVDDIPGCRENDFVRAIEVGTRAQEHCPKYQLFL